MIKASLEAYSAFSAKSSTARRASTTSCAGIRSEAKAMAVSLRNFVSSTARHIFALASYFFFKASNLSFSAFTSSSLRQNISLSSA